MFGLLIYYSSGCSTLCSAAGQSSWCRPGHNSLLRRTFTLRPYNIWSHSLTKKARYYILGDRKIMYYCSHSSQSSHPTHGTCYTLPKRKELFVGRISKRPPTFLTRKDGPHSRKTIVRLDLESILLTVNYIKDTTEEAGLIKSLF
jgi:hypothetical protein